MHKQEFCWFTLPLTGSTSRLSFLSVAALGGNIPSSLGTVLYAHYVPISIPHDPTSLFTIWLFAVLNAYALDAHLFKKLAGGTAYVIHEELHIPHLLKPPYAPHHRHNLQESYRDPIP